MKILPIKKKLFLQASEEFYNTAEFKGSVTKGDGYLAGVIGELAVAEYLKAKRQPTKDYDLIKDDIKIDVKTKRTSVKPKEHYMCSIFKSSKHQQYDRVYFTRVSYDYKTIYLLGWITKEDFYNKAKFVKKGDIIDGSMKAVADCHNIQIKDLKKYWKI